jgi:hypothetical protein
MRHSANAVDAAAVGAGASAAVVVGVSAVAAYRAPVAVLDVRGAVVAFHAPAAA